MKKDRASAYIIIAGILWGCISIFLRKLTGIGLSPIQAVAVRTCTAFVILALFIAFREPSELRIGLRDVPPLIGTGFISLLLFSWCYFGSIEASGASVAVVLLYTSPVFVVLLSAVLFNEKLTAKKLIALALTAAGCVLVTGLLSYSQRVPVKAVVLGLGSGFFYALYSIFGRIALRRCSSVTVTVYTFLFAGVGSLIVSLMTPQPAPLNVVLCPVGIISTLCIALFCCVLPYLLYTAGLAGVETGRAAILATVEPAVGAVVGFTLFHEAIFVQKVVGIMLIFTAIIILSAKEIEKQTV